MKKLSNTVRAPLGAVFLGLTLLIAGPVLADSKGFVTQDQMLGRTPGNVMIPGDTFIPGDAFFPKGMDGPLAPQITRNLAAQDITTIGDFIRADPHLIARILETEPRMAHEMQRQLRQALSRN